MTGVADVPLTAPVTAGRSGDGDLCGQPGLRRPQPPGRGQLNGALVSLTVPVGEPGAAPDAAGSILSFTPSGLPGCVG